MLKVGYELYDPYNDCIDPIITIGYDGFTFTIAKYDDDAYAVMCWRRGQWDYYDSKPYSSISEACEAIFYGTILVNRTEAGYPIFDKRGNIIDWMSRTYYDFSA